MTSYLGVRLDPGPIHQLEHQGGRSWRSTGEDPQFLLSPEIRSDLRGWAVISIELASDARMRLEPMLYVDDGAGFRESLAFPLPRPNRRNLSAVLRLPQRVECLRFDPASCEGQFLLGRITVRRLSRLEAWIRLSSAHARAAARQPGGILGAIHRAYRVAREGGPKGIARRLGIGGGTNPATSYREWVRKHDSLSARDRMRIRRRLAGSRVRFAIFHEGPRPPGIPVYESYRTVELPQRTLEAAKLVRDTLKREVDYAAFLPAGAALADSALFEISEAVRQCPGAAIIYSDDDSRDSRGERHSPRFKPDWNPELFDSTDYVGPAVFFSREIACRSLDGDSTMPGSPEMRARAFELASPALIRHWPRVLFHFSGRAPSPPRDWGRLIVESHGRRGTEMEATPDPRGFWKVRLKAPSRWPKVTAVIATRDRLELLEQVVRGLQTVNDYPNWNAIIVDNQSREPRTLDFLRRIQADSRFRVARFDAPFNFSAINNFGVGLADGDLVALLNNDLKMIRPNWLTEMVLHSLRNGAGAVGARLLYADGRLQHGGVILGIGGREGKGGVAGHLLKYLPGVDPGYCQRAYAAQSLSAVTAACLLVSKQIYLDAGGFDAENLPIAFNDVDLCLRIRALGYRNVMAPSAELYHLESASRGSDETVERRAGFAKEVAFMLNRWKGELECDPAYNPNLTLAHEDFALAFPPRSAKPWIPY